MTQLQARSISRFIVKQKSVVYSCGGGDEQEAEVVFPLHLQLCDAMRKALKHNYCFLFLTFTNMFQYPYLQFFLEGGLKSTFKKKKGTKSSKVLDNVCACAFARDQSQSLEFNRLMSATLKPVFKIKPPLQRFNPLLHHRIFPHGPEGFFLLL